MLVLFFIFLPMFFWEVHNVDLFFIVFFSSHFLYPAELTSPPVEMPSDSRPEAFRMVNHTVQQAVRHILLQALNDAEATERGGEKRETVFVGALSRSLCCEFVI